MDIRGFIETSFLDWDGKITSVIFVPGCNFRCPFCNNAVLVLKAESLPPVDPALIDEFILKRKDFIDGVVITGGEPTLQSDLPAYLRHLKSLGFLVKLDTNGSNPNMLKDLLGEKLLDYVAMDLKAPLNEKYLAATGASLDPGTIRQSVNLLMGSGIDYEFRTTVCPAFLKSEEVAGIAREIPGAKKFVLQQFVPKDTLDPGLLKVRPYSKDDFVKMAAVCREFVKNTIIRGV
ncbi:MAG: anaerobic ribonucleoside-triphosphate reductase activating protein [Candidatus Margulisiibacteriota bacterium]